MPRKVVILSLLFATLTIGGCASDDLFGGSGSSSQVQSQQAQLPTGEDSIVDPREKLANLASQVPEFGNYFFGKDGNFYICLTNPTQEALETAKETLIASRGQAYQDILPFEDAIANKCDYSYSQLYQWYNQFLSQISDFHLGDVLAASWISDVRDLINGKNRIYIRVTSTTGIDRVKEAFNQLQIPLKAVAVEVGARMHFSTHKTLTQKIRPLEGGVEIYDIAGDTCTLGWNAFAPYWDTSHLTFVMNSHCTGTSFQYDGDDIYQPQSYTNYVGTEIVDRSLSSGGSCPSGYSCRWSDAALIQVDSNVSATRGHIAHPVGIGSIHIDDSTPHYRITQVFRSSMPIALNTQLSKVGKTTGLTSGMVTNNCATYFISSTKALLCQVSVQATSDFGDSGSPFFKALSDSNVMLTGILTGGVGPVSVYSPIYPNMEINDTYNTLYSCYSGYNC